MQLSALLADDGAVSPAIGVILMVAITVVLAAVIGTWALGFDEDTQSTMPSVSFEFDYENDGAAEADGAATVRITHRRGVSLDGEEMTTFVAGEPLEGSAVETDGYNYTYDDGPWSGDVSAGSAVEIGKYDQDEKQADTRWEGERFRIVLQDGTDDSATIAKSEALNV